MSQGVHIIGTTLRWTVQLYDADGLPVDADSTPTVSLRINQAATAQTASIAKRDGATGLYDASATLAGINPGDHIAALVTAVIDSETYKQEYQWIAQPNPMPTLDAIQQEQAEQGDVLVEIQQQTSLIADAGGAEVTLTCRDVNGNPLAGVVVWLTTSNEPSPATKGQRTSDDFGIVKFVVTPGTYYVWQRAAGYQFNNPQQITVP